MSLGITVGKFLPFHLGHDHLIRRAKAQVDHLVVLVGYKPAQRIPGPVRADWIRAMHPDVEVIETLDDIPEAPEPWARRALDLLGGRRPDVAFTSEAYGDPWAAAMGARHVCIDPERGAFPVSGTALRRDLGAHWEMLAPPAKAYFARRVCVVGVESSGTTTLASALAERYRTAWVPEYGRTYWEGRRHAIGSERWDTYEFLQIAAGQSALEDHLATRANRVLVCDTDPLATHLWHRRYTGALDDALMRMAAARSYALYVLTEPDFGWVQDGTRDGEHVRMEMHQWFADALRERGSPFITVGGAHERRMAAAVAAIDPLLAFEDLGDP